MRIKEIKLKRDGAYLEMSIVSDEGVLNRVAEIEDGSVIYTAASMLDDLRVDENAMVAMKAEKHSDEYLVECDVCPVRVLCKKVATDSAHILRRRRTDA